MCLKITKIYSCGHAPVIPAYCENFKPDANGILFCPLAAAHNIRFTIPCGVCQRKSVEEMNDLEALLENLEM